MKIGILKETKTPPDRRVPVTPLQAEKILTGFPGTDLLIQSSNLRCFTDKEYTDLGLNVGNNISECNILLGVKEVHMPNLIEGKTYLFFSHTAKKQPYNRPLLQEIVKKRITLLDYEYLTDKNGLRLVAFGRWAGIVGAYNGLRAWGKRTGSHNLISAHECHDMEEMLEQLNHVSLPAIKILITGGGRVANGALETFSRLKLKIVSPEEYVRKTFDEPVLCRLDPWDYTKRRDGSEFGPEGFDHFVHHPDQYESTFLPYTKTTDLFIACHYWDPQSPVFMKPEDYLDPDFSIRVIADVSCDIQGPIPSTIRASSIAEPFYGYDPRNGREGDPFDANNVTVMAVDNLPGELPRNASEDFGNALLEKVFPSLFGNDREGIVEHATIVKDGKLTKRFEYLKEYLEGRE